MAAVHVFEVADGLHSGVARVLVLVLLTVNCCLWKMSEQPTSHHEDTAVQL